MANDNLTLTGKTLPVALFSYSLSSLTREPFERMAPTRIAELQFKSKDGKKRLYLGDLKGFDYQRDKGMAYFEAHDVDSVVRNGQWVIEGLTAGPIPTAAPFDLSRQDLGPGDIGRLYQRNWELKALYIRPAILMDAGVALPISLDAIMDKDSPVPIWISGQP